MSDLIPNDMYYMFERWDDKYLNDVPKVYLAGIPFDGTTSFRPGARFGPRALREASLGLESYSSYLKADLTDHEGQLVDLGDLEFRPSGVEKVMANFQKALANIWGERLPAHARLLTLGGEHSISYAPMELYLERYPDLVVVHLDAHADLRDGYLEEPYSHASVIFRVFEKMQNLTKEKGSDTCNYQLLQYGIRSGTRAEFEFMEQHKTQKYSLERLLEEIKFLGANRPIYLTLDLDFFDPAYLPGTGTPEAGGETFGNFMKILKLLSSKNLVGADCVELAPMLDSSGISSCLAAKVVREVSLCLLAPRNL